MNLFQELQTAGITSEMLDDLVHDAADRMGSFANNEGVQAQSALIARSSGEDPGLHELDDDAVADAASRIASRINNEGMKEQSEFLESAGFSPEEIRDELGLSTNIDLDTASTPAPSL